MTNVEALQALYAALGGTPSNVANASTSVEVLNAIAALFDGEDDAILNPEAIANIAAIAGSIIPEPTLIEKSITANGTYNASSDSADGYSEVTVNVQPNLTTKSITANGTYSAEDDDADGYSSVTVDVSSDNNANFVYYNNPIQSGTFSLKNSVEKIEIPEGFTQFGSEFNGAPSIREIIIPSTVTVIHNTAFSGANNLEKIIINKPEGSITDAPWSAPSSTQIIWNG